MRPPRHPGGAVAYFRKPLTLLQILRKAGDGEMQKPVRVVNHAGKQQPLLVLRCIVAFHALPPLHLTSFAEFCIFCQILQALQRRNYGRPHRARSYAARITRRELGRKSEEQKRDAEAPRSSLLCPCRWLRCFYAQPLPSEPKSQMSSLARSTMASRPGFSSLRGS